jgi:hypothetical protein
LPGLNDAAKDETGCVLDATGDYVGLTYDQSGTPAFRVYQRASQEFLTLPPDREFDSRSLFSEAYTAGSKRISWGGRLRGRRLRPAPYVAVLIATDPAGNLSLPLMTGFRVLRPEGDRRP